MHLTLFTASALEKDGILSIDGSGDINTLIKYLETKNFHSERDLRNFQYYNESTKIPGPPERHFRFFNSEIGSVSSKLN